MLKVHSWISSLNWSYLEASHPWWYSKQHCRVGCAG